MHLAYVDDSGGADTFTLACVIVEASSWPEVLDDLLGFRRFLRDRFGLPVRAEVKANHILRNAGVFRTFALSEPARFGLYRGFMRLQAKLGLSVFAVMIRKDRMAQNGITDDPRSLAWEYLLQRLERFTTKGKTELLLSHDEGDSDFIRKAARKARRAGTAGSAFGTGLLKRPAKLIVDAPVPRGSRRSPTSSSWRTWMPPRPTGGTTRLRSA